MAMGKQVWAEIGTATFYVAVHVQNKEKLDITGTPRFSFLFVFRYYFLYGQFCMQTRVLSPLVRHVS